MPHQLFPTRVVPPRTMTKLATTAGTGPNTFLRILGGTVRYMVVSLYGASRVLSVCQSMARGGHIRKLSKTELYIMAKRRPSDPDTDFHDGKMMLDTGTETDDTVFETELRELETSAASQVATTLFESAQSPLTTPMRTSQAAAGGMSAVSTWKSLLSNNLLVQVFQLASTKVACKFLLGETLDTVKALTSKVAACNKSHLFAGMTAFRHFISDGVARLEQTIFITSSYTNVRPHHLECRLPDVSFERIPRD